MSDHLTLPDDNAASSPGRSWLFRLETWLVLAALFLLFQAFPGLFWRFLYIVDVRNWTWGVWVAVEIAVVVTLLALRRWQNSD